LPASFGGKREQYFWYTLLHILSICVEFLGNESSGIVGNFFSIKEGDEIDLLVDVVGVLEANCSLFADILSCTRKVCSRLFDIFFPKKKKTMPKLLGNLVQTLDTSGGPTLPLKRLSTEIGAKVTMTLTMSHGKKVDWDKVSSSMAKGDYENDVSIKIFLEEAKKFSSKMTALILPDDAPSSSAAPAAATTDAEVESMFQKLAE
jgi:hypothetical protein